VLVTYFRYSAEVLGRFPDTRGGVIHASGLANGPTSPGLLSAYLDEQERVRARLQDVPVTEVPQLAAWRRTFTGFGVKPTQYRNAAEALLRRVIKQGDVPSINLLVDLANLVSLRYQLPVAVFDQRPVTGATSVRFASGGERFTDLGTDAVSHPDQGEVVFVDDDGLVSARRWCWRQSAQSAAAPVTVEAIITVEGQHEEAQRDVTKATDDLLGLLSEHQPGAVVTSAILSPGTDRFPA
jgi:DNA/RNA-binding domain of Phe-tRNA-synthetase-like protein